MTNDADVCSASPRHSENEASSRFSGNDTFNCLRESWTGLPESRGFKERAKYLLARVNKDEDALAKFESVALSEIVDLIQVNVYLESSGPSGRSVFSWHRKQTSCHAFNCNVIM